MVPLAELERLAKALDTRATEVAEAEAWYSGNHPLPLPPPNTAAAVDREARKAFDAMARLAVTNFLAPVVDVPQARLNIEGFRFSESPTSTDTEAWDIYRRNHLDGDSDLVHEAALKTGQGFAIVWPNKAGKAEITVEDPSQTIVAYEAGSRRRRRSALKRWVGEDGLTHATLYTPTEIYKYQSGRSADSPLWTPAGSVAGWQPRIVEGETWPLHNPWGEVPVIEIKVNPALKASLFGGGASEFAGQINEQRKINQTVMHLLVTMEHQSFRQRWVTGWDYPQNEDGTPDKAAMLTYSAARLQVFKPYDDATADPSAGIKVGEFSQADFRPFIDIIDEWVKTIAVTSGTPPYAFLLGNMINVAADPVARLEGIQTGKLLDHSRTLGEGWGHQVIRLALKMEGNPKANDPIITTVWSEFEQRTATEQANLAVQAKALGAPKYAVFAMFPGVDQTEAGRWVKESLADELRTASEQPAPKTEPVAPRAA